jgi:hypothetical protein
MVYSDIGDGKGKRTDAGILPVGWQEYVQLSHVRRCERDNILVTRTNKCYFFLCRGTYRTHRRLTGKDHV